ncbi:MAG: HAMP domain-containing sensor histidine kinase, partial [Coprobacillus sp.]
MKKYNLSLIVKITGIVFIAFAIVLGNEIRLGIDRYIKNTIETDAEATAKNLDQFSKDYSDMSVIKKIDLKSDEFTRIYDQALASDSSKVKSLVSSDGKILNISRENIGNATLCMTIKEYRGSKNIPVYFDMSSVGDTDLEEIEKKILEYQDNIDDIKNNAIQVKVNAIVPKGSDRLTQFNEVSIQSILFDNKEVMKTDVVGDVETIEGKLDFYTSYNVEIYINPYEGSFSQAMKQDNPTNYEVKILNYKDAMKGLRYELTKDFKKFIDTTTATSSNYGTYYLLKPYEYNGKQYSTVMIKLMDLSSYMLDDGSGTLLNEQEIFNKYGVGYVFVTQEYTDLTMKAMNQFIIDNYSTYFLAFVLIVLICLSIAYMIIKPIRRIEMTAKHLARKEFDYPVDMTRHDELGDLARSIDSMSKELEKTINNLHQEIERVQKLESLRKDFVSNFTHEIKTPLGIINGFSELVELESNDQKRNEYIQIIQGETKRINELVLAMLDLSKLESQNVSLTLEEIDLLDIVDDCLDSMMYLFEKKNIHVSTYLDSSVITADKFKMEMVINNFISNALRYTSENNEVIIHLDEHEFSIENEGNYIPDDQIDKIWMTFHKVDKARNEEGTGLGLAICKA